LIVGLRADEDVDNARRWLSAGPDLHSQDPQDQLQRLVAFLSTFLTVPFLPAALNCASNEVNAELDKLADHADSEIQRWARAMRTSFLPCDSVDRARQLLPPSPSESAMSSSSILLVKSWEELLTDPSAALIGPKAPIPECLRLHLRLRNTLVRNIVVAQAHTFRSMRSNSELRSTFVESMEDMLDEPSQGFRLVQNHRSGSASANVKTIVQRLRQPALPGMDDDTESKDRCKSVTPMPSLIHSLNVSTSEYNPRFVTVKIEGLPANASGHPFVASDTTSASASPTDSEAKLSLEAFFLYNERLRTPLTKIHLPPAKQKRNVARAVVFLTTPTWTIPMVKKTLSHWRWSRWHTAGIMISKPVDGLAICQHCQQPGHYRSQCPHTAAIPQALCARCGNPATAGHTCISMSKVTCTMCAEKGHTAGLCGHRDRTWAAIAMGAPRPPRGASAAPLPPSQQAAQQQQLALTPPAWPALPSVAARAAQHAPQPADLAKWIDDAVKARTDALMDTQRAQFQAMMDAQAAQHKAMMEQWSALMAAMTHTRPPMFESPPATAPVDAAAAPARQQPSVLTSSSTSATSPLAQSTSPLPASPSSPPLRAMTPPATPVARVARTQAAQCPPPTSSETDMVTARPTALATRARRAVEADQASQSNQAESMLSILRGCIEQLEAVTGISTSSAAPLLTRRDVEDDQASQTARLLTSLTALAHSLGQQTNPPNSRSHGQ
jgi:hypothetical protein